MSGYSSPEFGRGPHTEAMAGINMPNDVFCGDFHPGQVRYTSKKLAAGFHLVQCWTIKEATLPERFCNVQAQANNDGSMPYAKALLLKYAIVFTMLEAFLV